MDFNAPIYSIQNAYLKFSERPLFSGLDLFLEKGRKYCLVGRNGCGKSTLLKVIADQIEADHAEVFLQPGTFVSYMAQEDELDHFSSLREVVLSGLAEPLGALIGWLILKPIMSDTVFGILFAGVAGIMIFISFDELLPAAREYGEHHLSIYGLISGMVVMAISLLLFL